MINVEFYSWPKDVEAIPLAQLNILPEDLMADHGILFYDLLDGADKLVAACVKLDDGSMVGFERYNNSPIAGTTVVGFAPLQAFLVNNLLKEISLGWEYVTSNIRSNKKGSLIMGGEQVSDAVARIENEHDPEAVIEQDPIEKDPTHDHDEEALDDAAEKMAVEREDSDSDT